MKEKIQFLESEMLKHPQVEVETSHFFPNGLYAREIFIKSGTLLTGKAHKEEHLNIISKGKIAVWTEDGMKIVSAPCTMVSKAGIKRIGYAIEDTVWTTIHANFANCVEIEKLEQELVEESSIPKVCLEAFKCLM